mmetsp:Transcript_17416/g.25975  ORF Transcript_17416/g.25975 Transcript_17416/m.25975 type:complete len:761 (-) Transcript_17416:8-2290(-)
MMNNSILDISGDDYLKVLVCSANVGNAEPTPTSFSAWVPYDGEINGPLTNTPYPVGQDEINLSVGPYAAANNCNDNSQEGIVQSLGTTNEKQKFDIIVLGMQEAAFVNKQKKDKELLDTSIDSISNNVGGDDTASSNNNNTNNIAALSPPKSKGFKNPLKKGAKKAAKAGMVMRGISANQTYKRDTASMRNITGALTVDVLGYDNNKLNNLIKTTLPSYEMVTSSLRGEMRLFVLAHSTLAEDISEVYVGAENTGIGSIMANKGGIIVTFVLRDMTRFSFMTCHLEAHEGMTHYTNRNKNLAEILGGAKTDPVYNMQDATITSHHMFLCGDLNYRIKFSEYEAKKKKSSRAKKALKMSFRGPAGLKMSVNKGSQGLMKRSVSMESEQDEEEAVEEEVVANKNAVGGEGDSPTKMGGGDEEEAATGVGGEKKDEPANGSHFDQAKALVKAEDWKALNGGDELAVALKQKECLVGFSTLPCHWPPTFKVARGEGYQYNEKRTPSYTDRILWKSAEGMTNNVIPFLYEPCPDFITSDHKPIRGGFAVKLNKCRPPHNQNLSNSVITQDGKDHPVEQQIQILVSDMKCTNLPIMDNELIGGLSDPYVKFVSSPKELLYSKAWPSSSIITKSLNPVWNENYHLTMDGNGMENGLAEGAMFMLTVVDYDATSGDDVIGTVALNLNELVSELDLSGAGSSDEIQETHISRPILRNGQEYGMLECKLKAAFLAPKEVKSFLSGAKHVKTATKTSWKSKMQAFTGLAIS